MLLKKTFGYLGASGQTKVTAHENETIFTALADCGNAGYSVTWSLNAPIADSYILVPGCAYDGNRFETVLRRYPPMFLESELEVNPPVRITEVPHLKRDGDSFMDVTTGDLTVPCVCVLNKRTEEAFMVFFEQGAHGRNHGVTLEQQGDILHVTLRAPVKRRLVYRWYEGVPSLRTNDHVDAPLSLKAGEETRIAHRVFTFPCADIPELYEAFFKRRAELSEGEIPASLPGSTLTQMLQHLFDTFRYNEDYQFYHLDTVEKSASNKFTFWQAGWVGGGMNTLPAIVHGSEESREKAVNTLKFAAKYQSKAGFYYGIVSHGKVFHDCFGKYEGKYNMLLIRKHADMVYYLFKQIIALQKAGLVVDDCIYASAAAGADAIVRLWKKYGQLGQFVNAETGEIVVGGSTAGALAPAALCAAAKVTGNMDYLECAREIARFFYENATRIGVTTGGPGEILQCPDSESSAALLESFVVLCETDKTDEWLRIARDAAHQLASWVVSYNYLFPENSRFGRRDVRTIGSVWANVQNKHSAPGLCTLSASAYLKLYRLTGDERYLRIMSEIARFIPQTASCPTAPMYTTNGNRMRNGEICERVNMSDWEGRSGVGDSIFGSASWPEISGMMNYLEVPGVYVTADTQNVYVSDHVNAYIEGSLLHIENPTAYDAQVKVMIENTQSRQEPLSLYYQERMPIVTLHAGEHVTLPL